MATIRLKAVRGRVLDPYRGTLDLEQPERFTPRDADMQPFDALADALAALPDAKVVAKGRRFAIKRGDQAVRIVFASAARRVSIEDLSLQGDAMLAIHILHALVPLLGAVEIREGRFVDLVDGHEPPADIAARYDAYWIDESL